MTATAVLQIVDKLGVSAWWWIGTFGGRHLEEIRSYPASSFDDVQPATIGVSLRHGGPWLGAVSYLENGISNDDLTAVAVLDCEPEEVAGLYCSAEITAHRPLGTTIATRSTLDGIGLVGQTAGVAAIPVKAWPGDFRRRWERGSWNRPPAILERAATACGTEYRSAPPTELRIHRPVPEACAYDEACAYNERATAPVSNSGRFRMINGQRMEIQYSAPYPGIVSVR